MGGLQLVVVFAALHSSTIAKCIIITVCIYKRPGLSTNTGSAQNVPCFTGLGCGSGSVGLQVSALACCSMADTLSYRPTVAAESCFACYGKLY